MKTKGLSSLAVVAILLAAVLAPAMGALSLMNNSNSSVNESSDYGSNTNTTDLYSNDTVQSQSPQPTYNDTTNSSATTQQPINDTDTTEHHVSDVKERVIVGFKEKPDTELIKEHGGEIKHKYNIISAIAASLPEKAIDALKNNPHVAYIERDYEVQAIEDSLPWGVDRIDAELVWNGTEGGCDITEGGNAGFCINISVLDTGIDYNHLDLADNYKVFGYDFVNGDTDPMDDNGHGTHCAGIIAAVDNDIGVIGVAPEAGLYAVKVLDSSGSGYVSDVIAGIEWSVNNSMNIISMSLGSDSDSTTLHDACNAAYSAGLVLVAAAGNDGNPGGSGDNVDYPARYENVIAVAATDSNNNKAKSSSTGPAVELAAPGVDIYSTCWDDPYATKSGTSMACPHVTGTAALVWNGYPEYNNTQVRQRMQETAEDIGVAGKDTKYGYGLVNASEATRPTGSPNESPVVATPKTYDNTTLEEKTVFERNDSIFINVSISDVNGASDLNTVLITILNTTNAAILNNDTMTQDTPITDGYVYNYSWTVPSNADLGTWTINVYANDTSDAWDSNSTTFEVQDLKPPQWSDLQKNKTTLYQNDYVKFTANWTDDVALAGYIFSINQTGTWENSSFVPFNGTFNISENVTQITAPVGTTVQWRFYANDTADNWNVTDIQSFVVESAEVITPVTPFMIYGPVFYEDCSECNGSTVNITNLDTGKQWSAKTNTSYNYYQLILDTTNISAGNVLEFNATDGSQYNTLNHTVTQKNITDGGIFDFNLTIGIKEPVKIRNYDNTTDLDSWAFSGGMGENVPVSWQNSSNGTPTCVIWNSGPNGITVCIYAANFTDGDGVQFNPNATEKIVVRDDGNATPIDWSAVTDYVSNKNESSSSWYNFTLETGEVRDVYLQLCIPMNVKSGTYNSTFYAKKE